MNRIQEVLAESGGEVAYLSAWERQNRIREWRTVFAASVKSKTGMWRYGGLDWHAFSYNFSRALIGSEALAAYSAQPVTEFVVIPEKADISACYCRGPSLPDFSALCLDIYIFDPACTWTMVFTHVVEYGPYFSKAEW